MQAGNEHKNYNSYGLLLREAFDNFSPSQADNLSQDRIVINYLPRDLSFLADHVDAVMLEMATSTSRIERRLEDAVAMRFILKFPEGYQGHMWVVNDNAWVGEVLPKITRTWEPIPGEFGIKESAVRKLVRRGLTLIAERLYNKPELQGFFVLY